MKRVTLGLLWTLMFLRMRSNKQLIVGLQNNIIHSPTRDRAAFSHTPSFLIFWWSYKIMLISALSASKEDHAAFKHIKKSITWYYALPSQSALNLESFLFRQSIAIYLAIPTIYLHLPCFTISSFASTTVYIVCGTFRFIVIFFQSYKWFLKAQRILI